MDIGKSFTFQFKDPKWFSKLLIGALVNLVPILNFAYTGFLVDLLKNVVADVTEPLPEWTEFGDKFMKGLLLWLASIVYGIPLIVLGCIMGATMGGLGAFTSGNYTEGVAAATTGVGIIFSCLMILYALALSFYLPAVLINFARKGTFGSCFEFSAIFAIVSRNLSKYLTAWVVSLLAGIVVGIIISIVAVVVGWIPCIGWLLVWLVTAVGAVYMLTIGVHLFGQVAKEPAVVDIVS
jgi:MFS family permease